MKRADIEPLLPEVFRRTVRPGNPLSALLDVMEALHAPSEEAIGALDGTLNAYRTPDAFVPYLAGWLDLVRLFDDPFDDYTAPDPLRRPISTGLGRLRELIASAAHLSQWRGTARGLLRFLEVATGEKGFEIDEHVPGAPPFHIKVRAPQKVKLHAGLIERIVRFEKPAYVTYELEFIL